MKTDLHFWSHLFDLLIECEMFQTYLERQSKHIYVQLLFFFFRKSCRLWENVERYRVIYKSRRDFRLLRYSSRDGHAEGENVNRGRDTPSFCPTLQVLHISTLGDAADVNPKIKFLSHTCLSLCWHAPLRGDHPGYYTAEVGIPGGTYEVPCIYVWICWYK